MSNGSTAFVVRGSRARWLAGGTALALILAGCTGSNDDSASPTPDPRTPANPAELRGYVSAGEGVAGARLTVTTPSGDVVEVEDPTRAVTTSTGYFLLEVEALPGAFRVEATGGTVAGEPFDGTLAAAATDPEAFVYVNVATTIADEHRRDAGISHGDAHTKVQGYLGIPETVSLGAGLFGDNEHFHHGAFFESVGDEGLDAAVAEHVSRLDDPGATVSFAPDADAAEGDAAGGGASAGLRARAAAALRGAEPDTPPLGSVASALAGEIGTQLARGAVSAVAGELVGWGLQQLGLTPDIAGNVDAVTSRVTAIQQTLASQEEERRAEAQQLQSALDQVRHAVSEVSAEVQEYAEATGDALAKLSGDVRQGNYDALVQPVLDTAGTVATTKDALSDIFEFADQPDHGEVVASGLQKLAANALKLENQADRIPCFFGVGNCQGQSSGWSIRVGRIAADPLWTSGDGARFDAMFQFLMSTYVAQMAAVLEYEHSLLPSGAPSGTGSATLRRLGGALGANLDGIAAQEPYAPPGHRMVDLRTGVEFETLPFESQALFDAAMVRGLGRSGLPANVWGLDARTVVPKRITGDGRTRGRITPEGRAYSQIRLPGGRLPTPEEMTTLMTAAGDAGGARGLGWVLAQVGACTGSGVDAVVAAAGESPFLTDSMADASALLPGGQLGGIGCLARGGPLVPCLFPEAVTPTGTTTVCAIPRLNSGSEPGYALRCQATGVLARTLPAGPVLPKWPPDS
jgi:hypothetical protein